MPDLDQEFKIPTQTLAKAPLVLAHTSNYLSLSAVNAILHVTSHHLLRIPHLLSTWGSTNLDLPGAAVEVLCVQHEIQEKTIGFRLIGT